ncbi:MAG TPA: tRNA (adenosine(37)-N6)-threonylcarbamoyltransferase complex dimerization subunit type 1 TsaB [Nitrospira sp.]|nr:tRNA (adenosine(37)-N6)-threonylcarbamoyltransferase complex dimerization subunit type 1 TsaB [Nitrospira sp.]
MKVLAVETATSWQSVAILDDDRVLARCDQDAAGAHARLLLPAVDKLFSQTGLGPAKLDGLVVSIGPGSFTGLRVGLSTVLGFRTITRVPLAVVPTLEGMAWSLRASNERLCPVLNSRRGELYWAIFQWQGRDRLDRLTPEQVGSVETLAKQLSGSVMMFGEGWETERAAIQAMGRSVKIMEADQLLRPSAVSIGMAGIARLRRGEQAGVGISPLYVQRPEAEIKYEESGGISPMSRRQQKLARKLRNRPPLSATKTRRQT